MKLEDLDELALSQEEKDNIRYIIDTFTVDEIKERAEECREYVDYFRKDIDSSIPKIKKQISELYDSVNIVLKQIGDSEIVKFCIKDKNKILTLLDVIPEYLIDGYSNHNYNEYYNSWTTAYDIVKGN